jgi:hypothetical protein
VLSLQKIHALLKPEHLKAGPDPTGIAIRKSVAYIHLAFVWVFSIAFAVIVVVSNGAI